MAEKLDRWPDTIDGEAPRRSKYPWDEWLDGSVWRLRQGVDFQISANSFRSGTLPAAAGMRGLKATTRIVDDGKTIIFQALPRGEA